MIFGKVADHSDKSTLGRHDFIAYYTDGDSDGNGELSPAEMEVLEPN